MLVVLSSFPAWADDILFDASHREMAANADWIADADAWTQSMPAYPCGGNTSIEATPGRYPTPPQSGIGPATLETYWTGGISAWAVELAKAGHTVEQLPAGVAITFGNTGNPQDLANYDLFIAVEPNAAYSPAEKSALLAFVNAGGGLFMVGDHETSDRDCDGIDSPRIWNDLTGATSGAPGSAGVFGIWFRVDGLEVKGEDWFDDGTDNNVSTDPDDPIIHGPFGDGTGGLGFFGATSMDIDPALATAHVWRTGQAHDEFRVTFATASYGAGRVAAIGDSSPADDGTGDPGDTLYDGWDKAVGGVNNKEIHLNACHWLLNPTPDTTAPVITAGPAAAPGDCSATVTWTTDESATSAVAYGATTSYGSTASTAGRTKDHAVVLEALTPATAYHYQVSSTDASGNGPTQSADHTFTTVAATAPTLTAGPIVASVSGSGATLTWTTDEPATSLVDYGLTASYGSSASVPGLATAHSVTLSGLTAETDYHFRVLSSDGCGNGPATSLDNTFTTGPASLDISGWVLKQFNSTQTFTFPSGTTIPSGGYLVLGREATRAEFEAAYPSLPAAAVYLNSNPTGSCTDGCFPLINGDEAFELWNGTTMEDGTTIALAASRALQRNNPGDPAGTVGSWTNVAMASSNPGQGAGAGSGAGVVIHEMADASAWAYEFIELYYDAGAAQADTTPPAIATDLTALALDDSQIRLTWTAPGDDGSTGTATAYDLRLSPDPITSDDLFAAAAPISGIPAPSGAGSIQQFVVTGLTPSTAYHFAVKTRDEVPNWSGLSNSPSATTEASSDVTPPAPIVDLVATPLSTTSVQLAWTAPGDDGTTGTASLYEIRRSASRILSDTDFAAATPVTGMSAPKTAGGAEVFTVATGLSADHSYYFAVKTKDEASVGANWSGLSNCAAATTALIDGGSAVNHLVISQFQTGGSVDLYDDEFVELYNPTNAPLTLAGRSIQQKAATGQNHAAFALPDFTMPPRTWYLVARGTAYNGPTTPDVTQTNFNMSGSGGVLFLVDQPGALPQSYCSTSPLIIDQVAWGSGNCPETAVVSVPPVDGSAERKPGGAFGCGQDTGNNSLDFQVLTVSTPRNSATGAASPPSSLGNVGPTLYLADPGTTTFEWANAAAATGYRVYRGTTANFMAAAPSPWQTVATNTANDPATPSPLYFYVIRATDGTNESAD